MFLNLRKRGFCLVVTLSAVIAFLGLSHSAAFAAPAGNLEIVKIIDHNGTLQYEIVEKDISGFLKKEVAAEYKAAKEEWTKARDAWKTEHGKKVPFANPQPIKPTFKVVAKGIESRSDAKIELEAIKSKGPFCVVQVVTGKEKDTPEIVLKDEVKLKEHALEVAYHEKVQEWIQAKKEFEGSREGAEYARALPPKSQLKVLKGSLKSMAKANAYLSKYTK